MSVFGLVGLQDARALQRLMESNAGYAVRIQGYGVEPGAAQEALTALPPNAVAAQKRGYGLWEGNRLLAFADVIIGWPEPGTAHIGLLMTDSERVGEGHGRRLHEAIVTELRGAEGLCCLRLAIVDANADVAEPFWKKMGYQPTSQVAPHRQGTVESASRIWRRKLGCGAEASAGPI